MTTKELIALLQRLDPSGDLLVSEQRYSDDGPMDEGSWSLQTFYSQNGGAWYTKTDYRLVNQPLKNPTNTVHYSGN